MQLTNQRLYHSWNSAEPTWVIDFWFQFEGFKSFVHEDQEATTETIAFIYPIQYIKYNSGFSHFNI
jgi:hypothetical protein